jgi:NADH-ubiquinone oxidoreductase chain 3
LEGQTRAPFSVTFYLVGILFLLFDLELLITFPFMASLSTFFNPLGILILFRFLILLTVGFVFEIRLNIVNMATASSSMEEREAA